MKTSVVVLLLAALCCAVFAASSDNQKVVGHWQGILTGAHHTGLHYIYVFNDDHSSFSYETNIADDDDYMRWVAVSYFDGNGTVYFDNDYEDAVIGKYAFDDYTDSFVLAVNDADTPPPSSPYDRSVAFQANMTRLYNVGDCEGCASDPI